MRLLVDMNLTPRWVQSLADAGHEATHWSAVGAPIVRARQSGPSVVLLRGEPLVPEERGSALLLETVRK
jgi:hypothetical protein